MKNNNKQKIFMIAVLALTVCVLSIGIIRDKKLIQKNKSEIEEYNIKVANNEKIIYENYSEVYKKLLSNEATRIKLIGDSITAGVGIDSHYIPLDGRIIYDNNNGEVYRESAHTTDAWANHFRKYIENKFENVDFINAGIGGKSTEWAVKNKNYWLDNNEDIVFVMLGTNDRSSGDITKYTKNITEFLEYVDSKSKLMVVMSPPPASSDVEFSFGAKEINAVIKGICEEKEYVFISHYENTIKYSEENDLEITELINKEGSHPIEFGYKVMWDIIKSELDLD